MTSGLPTHLIRYSFGYIIPDKFLVFSIRMYIRNSTMSILQLKAYREINLVRVLDEDIRVSDINFCSTGPDSCFWE